MKYGNPRKFALYFPWFCAAIYREVHLLQNAEKPRGKGMTLTELIAAAAPDLSAMCR